MRTVILLTISNIFMTFAWYGHLKYRNSPLWKVILASWGIAFFEYCFQVPANRIGSYEFNSAQLKTIQESYYADGLFCVLDHLPWRYIPLELWRGLRVYRAGCVLYLPSVVKSGLALVTRPITGVSKPCVNPLGEFER